jgi:cytochrome b
MDSESVRVRRANGPSMTKAPSTAAVTSTALVWDWPLRVFHWLLTAAIAVSFATHYLGLEWFEWHRRAGYVALVLVAFRLVWGVVGPRHSRFASFVRGPRAVFDYLRGRSPHPVAGHNPLGAISVLAFLAVVCAQAATGLFANDEIANAGPFYGWITQETSNRITGWHELGSNVLLGLIALHLLAIAWYDVVRRAGLVRAMWTGRKAGAQGIESSRGALALLIVLALVVALALAVRAAPEATVSFF